MCVNIRAAWSPYIDEMTTHTASRSPRTSRHNDKPLANFSQCHLGIVSQLHALAQLPVLLAAAVQAREVAARTLALFKLAVHEHHLDEENELFPAVLRSAAEGAETLRVKAMVQRLNAEHRDIEARWKKLEPAVRAATKAEPVDLDHKEVHALVRVYLAHARYEEERFLPLAERILGRDGNHMAALGLALHLRHAPLPVAHI
jgi:hemerythrin-like domain-containing protein